MTKVMKKALALVLALTMVFSTVIVSNAAAKKTNKVTVNGVATTKKLTVKKGKTIKLTTGVKKCTVKSSKKAVVSAKVSKKTVTLKAKKVGTSKITISKKGYKNVVVTVKVTTISLMYPLSMGCPSCLCAFLAYPQKNLCAPDILMCAVHGLHFSSCRCQYT